MTLKGFSAAASYQYVSPSPHDGRRGSMMEILLTRVNEQPAAVAHFLDKHCNCWGIAYNGAKVNNERVEVP